LAPFVHNPSLPPPVHVWLAPKTLVAIIATAIPASVEAAFHCDRFARKIFVRFICIFALVCDALEQLRKVLKGLCLNPG
jgi:hypothetical protein